jgi:hypothetical protein
MFFAALFACNVAPPSDTTPGDTADSGHDELPILERRLRANYEAEEGLNLADGEVVVLSANNETEPAAEHADLHATLGRYIGLATYDPAGEGRLCAAGTGLASIADVATECDGGWMSSVQCAVNSAGAEAACAGQGFLVRPLTGDATYRMRVVTDDIVADGDYLAGVTIEIQG